MSSEPTFGNVICVCVVLFLFILFFFVIFIFNRYCYLISCEDWGEQKNAFLDSSKKMCVCISNQMRMCTRVFVFMWKKAPEIEFHPNKMFLIEPTSTFAYLLVLFSTNL